MSEQKDKAEPSGASAGSQPVAWAVFDGPDRMHLARDYGEAESCADDIGGQIVPLYRHPTLTDEEREAIREACDEGRWYPRDYHHIHKLRGLLERLC